MELERERGLRSESARKPDANAMPERLHRRPAASVPPASAPGVQLQSSGFALQLFADAVSAGVHPTELVQRAAAHGLSGSSSTLPHLSAIQRSFGRHDVSSVRAHVGRAAEGAAAMGAHGYASGDSVAFANAPDLHLAAHEAAHIVQQRAGVHLKGGVGEVGDSYERHADAVADLVVQGKSAESLLDSMAPSAASSGGVQRHAIQLDHDETAPAPSTGGGGRREEHRDASSGMSRALEAIRAARADEIPAILDALYAAQSHGFTDPSGSGTRRTTVTFSPSRESSGFFTYSAPKRCVSK